MVVNMNIVARIKFNYNLKKSSSEIHYYYYYQPLNEIQKTILFFINYTISLVNCFVNNNT